MGLCSRSWRALMRRNMIYRKRNIIGSLLEWILPVGFVAILVAIKVSLEGSAGFSPTTVDAVYPTNQDAIIPLSFGDYVTSIQAKRFCRASLQQNSFDITGMPGNNRDWQVPFVKCDGRSCQALGEDARSLYCEYQVLGVAGQDAVGKERAQAFSQYIYDTYPVLQNVSALPFDYPFIREFDSDDDIVSYIKDPNYGTSGYPKVGLAVVFSEGTSDRDFAYTIRTNSTNYNAPEQEARPATKTSPDTSRILANFAKKDDVCTPLGGTARQGALEDSCTGQYIYNGALVIQRLVGDYIFNATGAKDANVFVSEHGVQFVPFPSKEYITDGFYSAIAAFAPLLVLLGLMYPLAAIVRAVVLEKELRQKELMKMMSVSEADIGWSWAVSYFCFHIITIIGATAAMSSLYSNSLVVYLFAFWLLTIISMIVFAFWIASFMSKSTRATLVGLLFYFVGYFLTIIVSVETASLGLLRFLSLHPVTAFSYGMQEIGRLEDAAIGVTHETYNNTDAPSGYTFSVCIQSLGICCVMWGVLAWYFNRIIPSTYGTPLPWYFFLTSSYWCGSKRMGPSDFDDVDNDENIPLEPVSDALKQQGKEGKSVEIRNLKKQFGEKTAVDGLSLSMYSGQVTALLGHNGAGKTTTINMLTGMTPPTDGYAVVNGKDIRSQMNDIRQEVGICLQHDCLFPNLTVREHIDFFARVKGLYGKVSRKQARTKVMESIEHVALLEKRNTLAKNLSGGMKRKLSVAIAFCGDSKTVLLDEPTSGMDPFARRFTWDVIRQYREDRCIILTTHFMDEADILGDRIAIMAEGRLRCAGSSLFLKKAYGVGYQLTIEKNPASNGHQEQLPVTESSDKEVMEGVDVGVPVGNVDDNLQDIVTSSVDKAQLLSNVGTEMSFQLPLGASSSFAPMFEQLDKEVDEGRIVTYGVSITTLDEVFLMVARGETGEHQALASSSNLNPSATVKTEEEKSVRSQMDLEKTGLFKRHVRALFRKRAMNFKRDKKAWVCSTILPSVFVLIGFIVFRFASPTRDLDSLVLTLDSFNADVSTAPRNPIPFNNPGLFNCQPGVCAAPVSSFNISSTGEVYSFCGAGFFAPNNCGEDYCGQNCSIALSTDFASQITEFGALGVGEDFTTIPEASLGLFRTASSFEATQYGALYFTHEAQSTASNGASYADKVVAECQASNRDYVSDSTCENYRGYGFVVGYNFTALHSSLLYQSLGDEALIREALTDDEFTISPVIHPLPTTAREESYGKAEDAFTAWFLLVLSFPFITGSFGTFVVRERVTKAKHLQTVAGVKPSAYWLSTYAWDVLNYQFPCWITVILMFAFGIETFITRERGVVGGVLLLLVLFGPAAAGITYCFSYMFKSPSMCNLFVIVFNFFIGMAGPLVAFILRIIGTDPSNPNDSLLTAATAIEWALRFVPSFCLGRGLFAAINVEAYELINGEPLTVWDPSILLYEVIFLACECFVYIALAIQIDRWSTNPRAVNNWRRFVRFLTCRCFFCDGAVYSGDVPAPFLEDEDVIAEQDRVLAGEANNDLIVLNQLTKVFPPHKIAVNHMSFGIPHGQCFGLLGINGAGKTTTMGILTAEFPPSKGDATLAGYSVTREPEQTRRRIGYCPQFDAHFENMTGREHVELYAAIKGVPSEFVREAAEHKLLEVGLEEKDQIRLSAGYSGGMKRKLSVACATIGQPQIVFLDEPSTGMDPVARRDLWQVISDMVIGSSSAADEEKTSVILTTHSMEECEALCPRIGIMAGGTLKCLGSAQHLKTRFGQGYQVEMKLKAVDTNDEDYTEILVNLQQGTPAEGSEEGGVPANEVYLNLAQTQEALQQLTGDDFLVSMVEPNDHAGQLVYKHASSNVGVSLDVLASFACGELRMRNLHHFFESTYASAVLRERQDTKARYEVSSEGLRISDVFASIEEKKEELMLSDYGVSQTSLEQVFNRFAAEAEAQKQGTVDN